MDAFAEIYPIIVLVLGIIAASGGIIFGLVSASVFVFGPGESDAGEVSQRAFFAAFFLALGCAFAIVALAFTKWIVGL